MNGKLRKIALGMSVLMCAGMLFICALPVKAAVNACNHMSRLYLGWVKNVEKDRYDNDGHYYTQEEQSCCEMCGKIFVLRSETGKEDHHIYTLINWDDNTAYNFCDKCEYEHSYPVIVVN